jgi:hypothetical protein
MTSHSRTVTTKKSKTIMANQDKLLLADIVGLIEKSLALSATVIESLDFNGQNHQVIAVTIIEDFLSEAMNKLQKFNL